MRSPRWRRNQRLKCGCGGYHFPHRRGGGSCEHSLTMVYHRSLRQGMSKAEAWVEWAWQVQGKPVTVCPF